MKIKFLAQPFLNGFANVMEKAMKRDFRRLDRTHDIFLCNY